MVGGYSRVSLSDVTLKVVGSDPDISATINVPSLSGAFVGAGAETRITEHLSLRAEYRYTDFGSSDFNTGSGPQSIDSKENRVTFGIGMKF